MLDVFETMENCRAMRRLKPDPVPDDLIAKILHAGTCAPSGGNAQKWRFLVLKDRKIKEAVTAWYKKAYDEIIGPRYSSVAPPPGVSPEKFKRQQYGGASISPTTSPRRRSGSSPASTPARTTTPLPAPRSTRRCRTWCWPAARSGSARR